MWEPSRSIPRASTAHTATACAIERRRVTRMCMAGFIPSWCGPDTQTFRPTPHADISHTGGSALPVGGCSSPPGEALQVDHATRQPRFALRHARVRCPAAPTPPAWEIAHTTVGRNVCVSGVRCCVGGPMLCCYVDRYGVWLHSQSMEGVIGRRATHLHQGASSWLRPESWVCWESLS